MNELDNKSPRNKKLFETMKFVKSQSNVVLSDNKKDLLKNKILAQIDINPDLDTVFLAKKNFASVVSFIKNGASPVKLNLILKASWKERLFDKLPDYQNAGTSFWDFLFARRMWAGIVVSAFIFSFLLPFSYHSNLIYANKINYLKVESGQVLVKRGSLTFYPKSIFVLEEGDEIYTGKDGKAEIRFSNDSISRLDKETVLGINQLISQAKAENIGISFSLDKGRVWSKIVSFDNGSSPFIVSSDDAFVTANKKATFDISNNNGVLVLKSLENSVDLNVIPKKDKMVQKTVLEGYSVEVNSLPSIHKNLKQKKEDVKIEITKEGSVSNDKWIAENIKKDDKYLSSLTQKIEGEVKDKAGILPDDPLYGMKTLAEQAQVGLTFDGSKKVDLEADILMGRLLEISALFVDGKDKTASDLILEFQQKTNNLIANLKVLSSKDSSDVKERILAKTQEMKRILSPVLPKSNLYLIKKQLNELEMLLAISPVSKDKLKLEQASFKLMEIKELISLGKQDTNIKEELISYESACQEVFYSVYKMNGASRSEFMNYILDLIIADIENLNVIEKNLKNPFLEKYVNSLKIVRLENMNRMIIFIQKNNNSNEAVDSGVIAESMKPFVNIKNKTKLGDEYSQVRKLSLLKKKVSPDLAKKIEFIESLYKTEKVVEVQVPDLSNVPADTIKNLSATSDVDINLNTERQKSDN